MVGFWTRRRLRVSAVYYSHRRAPKYTPISPEIGIILRCYAVGSLQIVLNLSQFWRGAGIKEADKSDYRLMPVVSAIIRITLFAPAESISIAASVKKSDNNGGLLSITVSLGNIPGFVSPSGLAPPVSG